MLALDIDVLKTKFIDIYLEYRMLKNHNYDLLHGPLLTKRAGHLNLSINELGTVKSRGRYL